MPSETESALEKIDGLIKGEKRIAKGISVVVNPADRDEANGDGFAYCLHAEKNKAVIKSILLETKNSGCTLYDASSEGEDSEKLQSSVCLIVFLDKAFLADKHLTDILIREYQAGKDMAICMIENIENTDLPQELIGLHKMQWLNFAHGISSDMNTKLIRHLQKRGCRNIAILPGFEYEKTDEGIIIKRYAGLDPNPRIESEYGGVPVIEITGNTFSNNPRIESVIISEGITKLADDAFKNCPNLATITIPEGVTEIGKEAFKSCTNLVTITIPEGVTKIGKEAFRDCTSLTSISIPDSVTEIGKEAFRGCTGLASISISGNVKKINIRVFDSCKGLTSISIPDSVTIIEESAFEECTSLTSFTIPGNIIKISEATFKRCANLTSINIPDGVTEIGESAFEGCRSLNSIVIPNNISNISWKSFANCTSLTSIIIPSNVTLINGLAFEGCTNLASINIPDNISKISISAFEDCTSLTSIIIPDSVEIIGYSAFRGCTNLTSIVIPESVTSIGESAFEGCPNLTVACPPDTEAWKYCEKHEIHVSISENMKDQGQKTAKQERASVQAKKGKNEIIKSDNEVLEMTEENLEMIARLLYCSSYTGNYKDLSDQTHSEEIDRAILAFCIAIVTKAKICPLSYKNGTHLSSREMIYINVNWDIDARSLYSQKKKERGWHQGKYDYKEKTCDLTIYRGGGYWADHLEQKMNDLILALEKAGYGYFECYTDQTSNFIP